MLKTNSRARNQKISAFLAALPLIWLTGFAAVTCLDCRKTPDPAARTRADFVFLQPGMPYAEVVSRLGPPDAMVGSGFIIDNYRLADGSYIQINYAVGKAVTRADIHYPDGRRERLILPEPEAAKQ